MYIKDPVDQEEEFIRQENNLMSREDRNETLLLMQHHDSILQNYRFQFLIIQTLLLAITGFFVLQSDTVSNLWKLTAILLFSIFAGPFFIFFVWIPIVDRRNEMVARAEYLLKTNQMIDFSPYKIIGSNGSKYGMYFDEKDLKAISKTPASVRLDRIIPWAYAIFWLAILLYSYARLVLFINAG